MLFPRCKDQRCDREAYQIYWLSSFSPFSCWNEWYNNKTTENHVRGLWAARHEFKRLRSTGGDLIYTSNWRSTSNEAREDSRSKSLALLFYLATNPFFHQVQTQILSLSGKNLNTKTIAFYLIRSFLCAQRSFGRVSRRMQRCAWTLFQSDVIRPKRWSINRLLVCL